MGRHALEYALESEAIENKALEAGAVVTRNPFMRRPCRPLCAWDTVLTADVPGLKSSAKEKPAETVAPAKETVAEAKAPVTAQARVESSSRVERVLQAHKRANLLAKLLG